MVETGMRKLEIKDAIMGSFVFPVFQGIIVLVQK